jgi:hypothetical protein
VVGEGVDDGCSRSLGVEEEVVGLRRRELVVVFGEPVEGLVACIGHGLLAQGDELFVGELGFGALDGGGGHGVDAVEVELRHEIWAGHGVAEAESAHAVDLREGAGDDEVFVFGDEVDDRVGVGEVDVGLVDEDDGACGLVGEKPLDIGAFDEGSCGLQM